MGKIKVVCLDDYQDVVRDCGPWDELADRIELVTSTEHVPEPDRLAALLAGAEVVVAMRERTPFDRDLLERLPDLRLLVTKGMWNAAIDLEAARERGVVVSGTLNAGSPTVELTWTLILALVRDLLGQERSVRDGGWQRGLGGEVAGRTLGVIGLGRLGSKVATIGQAFGMDVVAWSQNLRPEVAAEQGVRAVTKDELLATSDVVTLHLKLSERSMGVIGAAELAAMKSTAFLVNTSRGPLVDEAALLDALRDGQIAGAGLDVYDVEPLPKGHPLRSAPNTVLTPHVGYVTQESYAHHFTQVVEGIRAWLDGAPVRVMNDDGSEGSS